MAFDESANGFTHGGRTSRRRWKRAEVVRSVPRMVDCVRVVLANGDEIVTTPEHPWLAQRYSYSGTGQQWVRSSDLMGSPGAGTGRGHNAGSRQPWYVLRQTDTWDPLRSFDAGWLSGMFDGEGSLSLGVHGTPKMTMCQVQGPVVDRAERLMHQFGYDPQRITRTKTPANRQPIDNLYVTGGFPAIMRALGELRPTRLLDKWEALDLSTRTVEAQKVRVVAVEPAGRVAIQEIETTSGTYIGEGYLHHNCYGNRMADSHEAKDPCRQCGGSGDVPVVGPPPANLVLGETGCPKCGGTGLTKRNTYTHYLRAAGVEPVRKDNSVLLQWGPEYRSFHLNAWSVCDRVLRRDGLALLNVKNHHRGKRLIRVVEFHLNAFLAMGYSLEGAKRVETRGLAHGANHESRTGFELILALRAPA